MSSFGLINNRDGSFQRHIGDFLPENFVLEDGFTLSFKTTIFGVRRSEPTLIYKMEGAEGRAQLSSTCDYYNIYVSGSDIKAVKQVIWKFQSELGAVNLTPTWIFLPKIQGAVNRLLYLIRYILNGTT